jgi:hypothetical protein
MVTEGKEGGKGGTCEKALGRAICDPKDSRSEEITRILEGARS